MKNKKTVKNNSKYMALETRIKELQDKVTKMDKEIFKEIEVKSNDSLSALGSAYFSWSWDAIPSKKITLEDKIDSIAKFLKIDFTVTPQKESEVIVVEQKPKKLKKKKTNKHNDIS
jgi:hypothetical protein